MGARVVDSVVKYHGVRRQELFRILRSKDLLISILLGIRLGELGDRLLALEIRYDLDLVNYTGNLRKRYGLGHRVTAQVGHEEDERRVGCGVNGQAGEGQRGILQR